MSPEFQEKVLETVVKKKKGIATSIPLISLTSKKKVVEKEKVQEEEVIATRSSISKNEVKVSRPMTKEVEVTSEPSNLPITLKYSLRYAKRAEVEVWAYEIVSSISEQAPPYPIIFSSPSSTLPVIFFSSLSIFPQRLTHDKSPDVTVAVAQWVTMRRNISSLDELQKKLTCLTSTPSTRLNPRTEKMTTAVDGIHFSSLSPFSYPVNHRRLQFPTLSFAVVLHPIFSISSSPQSPHK
uniref:Uncharacterized protein n=1 Tax=Cucumis melo TaxID=3656 RepID=A0A9I9EGB1_CUCME